MKPSISSIALKDLKKDNLVKIKNFNLEISFNNIDSWDDLTEEKLIIFKRQCDEFNISLKSAQSLFYNKVHLGDCISKNNNEKLLSHIDKIINFVKILKIEVLVFGSPTLRKDFKKNEKYIIDFFKYIDDKLIGTNCVLCIEPNSKYYGGEYFHTIGEIVNFIVTNNFSNIKTMIDTHNLQLENQDIKESIYNFKDFINHIHISEINLSEINLNYELINTIKLINKNLNCNYINYESKSISTKSINKFKKIINSL